MTHTKRLVTSDIQVGTVEIQTENHIFVLYFVYAWCSSFMPQFNVYLAKVFTYYNSNNCIWYLLSQTIGIINIFAHI